MTETLVPLHPGEVLDELYLTPMEMSAGKLAAKLKVPRTRIERLLKRETGVSPDTALRLAHFYETTPQYWMNMQTNYDLFHHSRALEAEIKELGSLSAA